MKLCVFLILIFTCFTKKLKEVITTDDYSVTKIIQRPETYYTQGLIYDKGYLYESGGLYGESVIVKMEYPSLKVVSKQSIGNEFFGEGIGVCGGKIYQLTWQERKILSYTFPDLKFIDILFMDQKITSGWGLAKLDDSALIATDGTSNIYFLDCKHNLKVIKIMPITHNGHSIDRLNALVFAKGSIYANRYYDSRIFMINQYTGDVEKVYDFQPLINKEKQIGTLTDIRLSSGDVLNGIAYDQDRDIFILTGKKWNNYYEVNFK